MCGNKRVKSVKGSQIKNSVYNPLTTCLYYSKEATACQRATATV